MTKDKVSDLGQRAQDGPPEWAELVLLLRERCREAGYWRDTMTATAEAIRDEGARYYPIRLTLEPDNTRNVLLGHSKPSLATLDRLAAILDARPSEHKAWGVLAEAIRTTAQSIRATLSIRRAESTTYIRSALQFPGLLRGVTAGARALTRIAGSGYVTCVPTPGVIRCRANGRGGPTACGSIRANAPGRRAHSNTTPTKPKQSTHVCGWPWEPSNPSP